MLRASGSIQGRSVKEPAWSLQSGVETRELDDPVQAALVAVGPLGVLPVLLGWSPELVGELGSVSRVMTRSGGLALGLFVN